MLEELNELKKEELNAIKNYLENELINELEDYISDAQDSLYELDGKIKNKIKNKEFDDLISLTESAAKKEGEIRNGEKKLEKAKELNSKVDTFTSDLSILTANEKNKLEKEILLVSEEKVFNKTIFAFRKKAFETMQSCISNSIFMLKADIDNANTILENTDLKAELEKLKSDYKGMNSLLKNIKTNKTIVDEKTNMLNRANDLLLKVNDFIANVESELISYVQVDLEEAIIQLLEDIKTFDVKVIGKKEEKIIPDKKYDLEEVKKEIEEAKHDLDINKLNHIKTVIFSSIEDVKDKNEILNKLNDAESCIYMQKATIAVDELENNMTEDALNTAKISVDLLSSGKVKKDLEDRVRICEEKIKKQRDLEAEIDLIKSYIKEAYDNSDKVKLQQAEDMLSSLEDGQEKQKLMINISEVKLRFLLTDCEANIGAGVDIDKEDINSIKSLYTSLKDHLDEDDNKITKQRINKIIDEYNMQDQFYYQEKQLEEKPKKYGILTRLREAVGGVIINAVRNSRHYLKFCLKKLDKAKNTSNDKKIKKYEKKLSDIGIINGVKLFMKRNKIASLRPKLYNVDSSQIKRFNSKSNRYEKAKNYVTNKVSKKIDEFSNNDMMLENKYTVNNVIMNYLDTLSMSNNIVDTTEDPDEKSDFDKIKEKATEFISDAKGNGVIDECEFLAYMNEINNIENFREVYDKDTYHMPYDVNPEEIDAMVNYYDSDPEAKDFVYVKNKGNN